MAPTIGRIVYFRGFHTQTGKSGVFPAIITAVHGSLTVDLTIFMGEVVVHMQEREFSNDGKKPGWFWPPRMDS